MKLPKLEEPQQYIGLYAIDFGDHSGVGFTADEVAELLESQRYQAIQVYKIYRASPDGTLEIKGVTKNTFQLESGLFFYTADLETSQQGYRKLVGLAVTHQPPCRAKVNLAQWDQGQYVLALIYPSEYEEEVSAWLIQGEFEAQGLAEGGVGVVQQYYDRSPEVLERHQLFGQGLFESRTGDELLLGLKRAVQR
ncbi:MAG: hypothetical protein HQ515_13035 [Phycisphaeraceae bacterium]|nr:hypothetical protein [Phycisphaeraceae bacterium]